jgi:uncharacterized membrane protein
MNIKQQAAINVAKIIGIALISGSLMGAILNFVPIQYIGIGAVVLMFFYAVRFVYQIEVDKLERLQALNSKTNQ